MSKTFTAPAGDAIYPRLSPGHPDTKYKEEGEYHTKCRYDSDVPANAAWLKQIDGWYDAAVESAIKEVIAEHLKKTNKVMKDEVARKKVKLAAKPYSFEEDEDGEETNMFVINFKMKAKAKNRKTGEEFDLSPAIFGAGKKALEGKAIPAIYSGSVLKVAYTPIEWFTMQLGAGVRLRLEAVKIIELVSSAKGSADQYGFGDEDEGYVPDVNDATQAFADDSDPGASAEDDSDGDF